MTIIIKLEGTTMGTVLTCLKQTGDGVTVADIAEACGISKNAVKGALQRLLKHSLVMVTHKSSRNLWCATPPTLTREAPPAHMPPLHGELPSA